MFENTNQPLKYRLNRRQWELLAKALDGYAPFEGLDDEKIARIRYTRAMLSHGIATAARIGMNKIVMENDALLVRFLTDASHALLRGYQETPPLEGDERRLLEEKIKAMRQYGGGSQPT
ncbi:MAG: hypothetical protein PVG51_08440 [Desulfosarcina sp.]|jgi:hypothetical protein